MPRTSRELSNSGFYHLISRGIDKYVIFYDDEDYLYIKKIIKETANDENVDVCCYCLMNNHFHLLIKMNSTESPSKFMKRVQIRYAYYFNHKYDRSGYVFQDRFKSECIEDEKYFLTVFRYICHNPVKAHMVGSAFDYRWSTAHELMFGEKVFTELFYVLSFMKKEALIDYLNANATDKCADVSERVHRITDAAAIRQFEGRYKELRISDIKSLGGNHKKEAISYLFSISCSERQISRITGINRGTLRRMSLTNDIDNMNGMTERKRHY